jgi:hypothetical protein
VLRRPLVRVPVRLVRTLACVAALAALASACGAVATSTNPSPGGDVAVPASITSNCSRDVTAELNRWIASVGDGSVLQFTPNACYRIDGTLRIENRNNLTFEGNGATFRAYTDGRELPPSAARTRSQLVFAGGSNLTVRNVIVRGANPNAGMGDAAYVAELEAQHGFVIGGTVGIVLDHVQVYDVYGDFVYVGAPSRNVLVENSVFRRNGRQGWTVAGGDGVTFDHNTISDTRRATIDMEPVSTSSAQRNVTFSNNTIGDGRLFLVSNHGAAAQTVNFAFLYNRLVTKPMTIHVEGDPGVRSHYRVIGNVSDTAASQEGGGVIYFDGTSDVEIRDNVVPVQPNRGISGVGLANTTNVEVSGNRFPDATAPIAYYPGNTNVHDVGNYIGAPLRLSPEQTLAHN